MLLELHAHSSGISFCANHTPIELVNKIKQEGLNGVVLVNHYVHWYEKSHNCATYADFVRKYVDEFLSAKAEGDRLGVKVFFGVEVSPSYNENAHLLIYGIEPEDFLSMEAFYNYSLQELFSLCIANGWAMVQAHPFRYGQDLQDLNYLHGLEINCNQSYNTDSDKVIPIALSGHVALTCGGDFHRGVRPNCGTFVPDDVSCNKDLANYLRTTKTITLRVQEVGVTDFYDKTFKLNR